MTNQEYMAQAWEEYDNLPFRINMNFIEGWHSGDVSDLVNSICQTPASVMLAIAGETEEESAPIQSVRRAGKSRHDKKAARRKGSVKRFRDRSRKCASEGHMYSVYCHGEKQSRTSVNIHFTDAARLDTFDMSEADVAQTWSVSSYDLPLNDFFQYMDNMDWKRIPSEVRFSVDWNTENPLTCGYPEPEYFEMTATLRKSQKTVSAEKARQEYLKFKKEYQVFQKYGEKLRALREEMYAELKEG